MPTDILLDENDDLRIENGDLVVGESTMQHQRHLFLGDKGHFRNSPISGIGISNYQNDDELGELYGEIQKQFELDGQEVGEIEILRNGKIKVEGEYEDDNG
jgi:hypothetical protein